MRALFLAGLLALGCGRSSSQTTSDLSMSVADLAMSVPDMAKYTCIQLVQCSAMCGGDLNCQAMCAANASPMALQGFGTFAACVLLACGPASDGGVSGNGSCPIPPDSTQKCQGCIASVGFQAALDPNARCHKEYVSCQTN
jgi:hypothetical protein